MKILWLIESYIGYNKCNYHSTSIRLSHTSAEVKWFKIHEHFKKNKFVYFSFMS